MLFGQQFLIRSIAIKHDSILKLFSQLRRALLISFDQLHAVVFFQPSRQTCANITAANQHNTFIRFFETLKFTHHRTDMLRSRNKEDFIPGFDNGGPLRTNRSVVTENRRNTRIDMWHMLAHCRQGITNQRAAVISLHNRQAYFSFRKVHNLQRARVLNQTINTVDNQLFRGNKMVDRYCFGIKQLFRIPDIVRGANAGDAVRCVEKRVGHLTCNHVGFIRTGYCNQHVGIVRARLPKHTWVRAVPLYNTKIKLVLQNAQAIAIGIHNGDIVVFAHEIFRQRSANLPCAQNDNFHLS